MSNAEQHTTTTIHGYTQRSCGFTCCEQNATTLLTPSLQRCRSVACVPTQLVSIMPATLQGNNISKDVFYLRR